MIEIGQTTEQLKNRILDYPVDTGKFTDRYSIHDALNFVEDLYVNIVRNSGGTKYDHQLRVVNDLINSDSGNPLTEDFIIAALLHDIFDNKSRNQESDEVKSLIEKLIQKENGEYILSVIYSTEQFEKGAEAWRDLIINSLEDTNVQVIDQNDHDRELLVRELINSNILNADSSSEDNEHDFMNTHIPDEVKNMVIKLLTQKGKLNANEIIPDEYWNFRTPLVDFTQALNVLRNNDIEGILIKAFEVMDNLSNPDPFNKLAGWRDAQELLSFYAPILSIAGYEDVTNRARSIALTYLNCHGEDPYNNIYLNPAQQNFVENYNNSINLFLGNNEFSDDMPLSQYPRSSMVKGALKLATSGEEAKIIERPGRIKSFGSSLEKLRKHEILVDQFAYRVIYEEYFKNFLFNKNSYEPMSLYDIKDQDRSQLINFKDLPETIKILKIQNLAQDLYRDISWFLKKDEFESSIGSEEKEDIEVRYGNLDDYEEIYGSFSDETYEPQFSVVDGITISLKPEKTNGYNAIHFTFKYIDDLGKEYYVEVQVVDEASEKNNKDGRTSHMMYKAKYSFGRLAYILRNGSTEKEKESAWNEVESQIKDIKSRTQKFSERNIIPNVNSLENMRDFIRLNYLEVA